ncbi:LuxR family transcriptional regulator [Nocardioides sp. YIM 152315]|uniref:LuxR family transcriptional regulator n=1 Tax=Nocardioides sp. YIM 152315 TaxID=3031760 RepID=UPI0023DB651F|nr:LuxR family transcriptional regulator [Nocardioides sp. YIM 152315]MDF1604370.1 LuxR family transcriptional regulator [Nocardioides sp. YIM 152315]
MARVVGRLTLLTEVSTLLTQGAAVAPRGPAGIGKSALLDALEEGHRERHDALVLRANGAPAEHGLPYAALQDLVDQLPVDLRGTLPALAAPVEDDRLRSALCGRFRALLDEASRTRPVLVLLDDAQWLDPHSACVIGYGRRRVASRVGLVATVGPVPEPDRGIDLSDLHELEVPPLDAAEMIELLAAHGVPAHVAQRLHVESGGLPSLALALGGAAREQPLLLGRPTPLPASLERVLRDRFLAQDHEVRTTLSVAALLHRPTVRQLERAGRVEAEAHVRAAAEAGLLTRAGDTLRFAPTELGRVVSEATPAVRRAAWHRTLAEVAPGTAERVRHDALADPRPDAALAREVAVAARASATAGHRSIATELYLLAADRAPAELLTERVEWLATAVETGAPGNHADLVHRALDDFLREDACPAQMVRVRLALPELAGSGVAAMDEVLTAALTDAGEDDRLVAMVLLQRSRVALMESRPAESSRLAERAAGLFRCAGDRVAEASALTTLAVAARWTGAGTHDDHLAAALALVPPTAPAQPGLTHTSPAYIAARFALYDDRLEEAWAAFLAMLARVERGAGMDQVHVLRCLVEVGVRVGRCREAMAYAARAAQVGEEFGLDPHTGWFISALAELAGGDLGTARTLAERGALAAEERGDTRYLQRHLLVLGQAELRSGDAAAARASLERIRRIEQTHGISDPTVNRWQPELVSALVALGAPEDAAAVLAQARAALDGRSGTEGAGAQLDRAEAELLCATGDLDAAVHLIERAVKVCADVGMRVDLGRLLLTRAHVERRARRAAAARATLEAAEAVFAELHAEPWLTEVRAELAPDPVASAGDPMLGRLTDTEARIAQLVCQGSSNRQIAERLHLSVKTVEAALTRIYRKLDVRSRTQLATLLVPAPAE